MCVGQAIQKLPFGFLFSPKIEEAIGQQQRSRENSPPAEQIQISFLWPEISFKCSTLLAHSLAFRPHLRPRRRSYVYVPSTTTFCTHWATGHDSPFRTSPAQHSP